MLDNETLLMASIFQKALQINPQPNSAEFLHRFEFEIDQTCRVLKFLGLVEEASSTLGVKPKHRLIEIIADRMVRPNTESKNPVAKVDHDFVDILWQLVDKGADAPEKVKVIAATVDGQLDENDEDDDYDFVYEDDKDDGAESWDARHFCCEVFVVLGLLKKGANGYMPSRLIHNLILATCV
jgi:hypothetical protein